MSLLAGGSCDCDLFVSFSWLHKLSFCDTLLFETYVVPHLPVATIKYVPVLLLIHKVSYNINKNYSSHISHIYFLRSRAASHQKMKRQGCSKRRRRCALCSSTMQHPPTSFRCFAASALHACTVAWNGGRRASR